MRIVFMGTADFGIPSLEALNEAHEIAAVVTRPDRQKGRGRSMQPCPVKIAAERLGLPVLSPERMKDPGFIDALKQLNADLFYVVAFRILPPEVFKIPPKGTVNLHAALLPDYRGAAPVNWAVINGDEKTGLTTFFIDENIDTGDILLATETPIGPDETVGELYDRLKELGAGLSLETINRIERGEATPTPQPTLPQRPAPKLFKEDGRIDWTSSAQEIHNKVRGMNPVPGAFTGWDRGPLKIHRTSVEDESATGEPGVIVEASPKHGLVVACGTGTLRLLQVQPPGKRPMDSASFVRGYGVEAGRSLIKTPKD